MTTSDILLQAADLIEREGWVQGSYHVPSGYCLVGALSQVIGGGLCPVAPVFNLMKSFVGSRSLPAWNDDPSRTKAEVLAALRDAARQTQE